MLKKLAILLSAAVLFFTMYRFMPKNLVDTLDLKTTEAQVFIYCRTYDGDAVKNGSGLIVQTTFDNYRNVRSKAGGVDGVSVTYSGNPETVQQLLKSLNVTVVQIEQVGEITCIYGFSPKLYGGVTVNGSKINVQIAAVGTTVSIGSPLILGSY